MNPLRNIFSIFMSIFLAEEDEKDIHFILGFTNKKSKMPQEIKFTKIIDNLNECHAVKIYSKHTGT